MRADIELRAGGSCHQAGGCALSHQGCGRRATEGGQRWPQRAGKGGALAPAAQLAIPRTEGEPPSQHLAAAPCT